MRCPHAPTLTATVRLAADGRLIDRRCPGSSVSKRNGLNSILDASLEQPNLPAKHPYEWSPCASLSKLWNLTNHVDPARHISSPLLPNKCTGILPILAVYPDVVLRPHSGLVEESAPAIANANMHNGVLDKLQLKTGELDPKAIVGVF
jgi:hypothetical protein